MPRTAQDHTLATRVAVRVVDAAGAAVGAGFLVDPGLVATCAHVVATAVGADPYAETAPTDVVRLDFPLLGESATAVVQRWLPIEEDGTGDIAVLRLLGPAPVGARIPPLRRMMLPVTPDGWAEQLCRITDRPFTRTEQTLVPAGTDVEAPCP